MVSSWLEKQITWLLINANLKVTFFIIYNGISHNQTFHIPLSKTPKHKMCTKVCCKTSILFVLVGHFDNWALFHEYWVSNARIKTKTDEYCWQGWDQVSSALSLVIFESYYLNYHSSDKKLITYYRNQTTKLRQL